MTKTCGGACAAPMHCAGWRAQNMPSVEVADSVARAEPRKVPRMTPLAVPKTDMDPQDP